MNAAVGSTCTAPCNQGFNSNPPPTVECKLVNATFADWDLDNMEPKLCQRGALGFDVAARNPNHDG